MTESTVCCPNCGMEKIFDMERKTQCPNCYAVHTPVEFLALQLSKFGVLARCNDEMITVLDLQGNQICHIDLVADENKFIVSVYSLSKTELIRGYLATFNAFVKLTISGIEPNAGFCPICDKKLSYQYFYTTGYPGNHFVGCKSKGHEFLYPLALWLGSTLSEHYSEYRFTEDPVGVKVSKVSKVVKTKILSFFRVVSPALVGIIKFGSDHQNLTVWVSKSVNAEIPGLISYINSLGLENIKAVLTND